MLTDEQLLELWAPDSRKRILSFARAVEAAAREDADECIKEQEDMLRELRAERDALRMLTPAMMEAAFAAVQPTSGREWFRAMYYAAIDAALAKDK